MIGLEVRRIRGPLTLAFMPATQGKKSRTQARYGYDQIGVKAEPDRRGSVLYDAQDARPMLLHLWAFGESLKRWLQRLGRRVYLVH